MEQTAIDRAFDACLSCKDVALVAKEADALRQLGDIAWNTLTVSEFKMGVCDFHYQPRSCTNIDQNRLARSVRNPLRANT